MSPTGAAKLVSLGPPPKPPAKPLPKTDAPNTPPPLMALDVANGDGSVAPEVLERVAKVLKPPVAVGSDLG